MACYAVAQSVWGTYQITTIMISLHNSLAATQVHLHYTNLQRRLALCTIQASKGHPLHYTSLQRPPSALHKPPKATLCTTQASKGHPLHYASLQRRLALCITQSSKGHPLHYANLQRPPSALCKPPKATHTSLQSTIHEATLCNATPPKLYLMHSP